MLGSLRCDFTTELLFECVGRFRGARKARELRYQKGPVEIFEFRSVTLSHQKSSDASDRWRFSSTSSSRRVSHIFACTLHKSLFLAGVVVQSSQMDASQVRPFPSFQSHSLVPICPQAQTSMRWLPQTIMEAPPILIFEHFTLNRPPEVRCNAVTQCDSAPTMPENRMLATISYFASFSCRRCRNDFFKTVCPR